MTVPHERRQEVRHRIVVNVTFESEHNFYTGLTQDLSSSGLFVATNNLLPEGERIHLKFTLPTSADPIELIAEVRWTRRDAVRGGGGEAGMGLHFLSLSPRAKEAINAFLKRRDSLFVDVD
jgi:type IV pilus assembly protein PilZ